jgi:hypothetical protein
MGLFDFFKKRTNLNIDPNCQTIYFKKGKLYKIQGGDETDWYDPRYLVSDGHLFDLQNVYDIQSIPIPSFDKNDNCGDGYGITGSMEYVLRMKAGRLYSRREKDLCSACLWKSTIMMAEFDNRWKRSDFDRLVRWHYELGMFEDAKQAQEWLNKLPQYTENGFDRLAKSSSDIVLNNCKKIGSDLVVFHSHSVNRSCCGECAKFNGRVYSISGKSKMYPKLPDYALKNGNFHPGCRCTMSAYFDGDGVYLRGKVVSAQEANSRLWEDDRSDEEKELYLKYISKQESTYFVDEGKIADKNVYFELAKVLPNDVPKSFSAYRRMKNSNSPGFQKLREKAKEFGIQI